MQLQVCGMTSKDDEDDEFETPPNSIPDSGDHVDVPQNLFNPCRHLKDFMQVITPLSHSDDYGKSLYTQAVQIVGTHLSAGCTLCLRLSVS